MSGPQGLFPFPLAMCLTHHPLNLGTQNSNDLLSFYSVGQWGSVRELEMCKVASGPPGSLPTGLLITPQPGLSFCAAEDKPQGPSTCQAPACILLANTHGQAQGRHGRAPHKGIHCGHQPHRLLQGWVLVRGKGFDRTALLRAQHSVWPALDVCPGHRDWCDETASERLWGEGVRSDSENLRVRLEEHQSGLVAEGTLGRCPCSRISRKKGKQWSPALQILGLG